jgi:hypothetical protein
MICTRSIRHRLPAWAPYLAGLFLCAMLATAVSAQNTAQQSSHPAPIERKSPDASTPHASYMVPGQHGQQHLSQWMDSHRNLPLDQQQRALAAEPGFRQLQPDEQARIHNRLEQLNTMSPEQRQRVIARTEAMERLSPPQRLQVRGALKDLGALPEDRRRLVARTFRGLRDLPPGQQQAYLNGPQLRSQFSEPERATLYNLLTVAPYLPTPPAQQQRYLPRR